MEETEIFVGEDSRREKFSGKKQVVTFETILSDRPIQMRPWAARIFCTAEASSFPRRIPDQKKI